MQKKFVKHQNKKRKIISQLKERDKVYLLIKNLKTKKKSKKLNYIKIELFFIKPIKELVDYKLNLLKDIRVFLVFYILLLKSIDFNTSIQKKFITKLRKKANIKQSKS